MEADQQFGDGRDNFAGGLSQAAKAVGQATGQTASAAGAEAAAGAAASVKAGAETGAAVSEIAAGTAAGGPWGAALSAAWSMRHTVMKILVCFFLSQILVIVMVVSLPGIVADRLFGTGGKKPAENQSIESVYASLSDDVSAEVDKAYQKSLDKVEEIIEDGNYDYHLSMEALINNAQSSAGYDVSYILAAYSASMEQQNCTSEDMTRKLSDYTGKMFPVTKTEKSEERLVPATYMTYKKTTVTVVTKAVPAAIVNGVQRYNYTLGTRTVYVPDTEKKSETEITVPKYREITVNVPVYRNDRVTGMKKAVYYEPDGEEVRKPTTETVKYVQCTINPFDQSVISEAFDLTLTDTYPQFRITYGEVIRNTANSLKMTLYGSLGKGQQVPLTDAELIAFVDGLQCSDIRKSIVSTGLSLVGRVPYFWGGKSAPGWNEEWNTPKLVTAAGSPSTGTIRPFGLDCSGFSDWTYRTALGVSLHEKGGQWATTAPIGQEDLEPGDLGFLLDETGEWTHVLIYAGPGDGGERMWVHSAGGVGVVLNTPGYEADLALRRPVNVDFSAAPEDQQQGKPLYSIEVDVSYYCDCQKCRGEAAGNLSASGKKLEKGMAAMSSSYPFGTQLMINGIMYTVEDRGDGGMESSISRVELYVPDHAEALRLGKFHTTAEVYRTGR